MTKKEYELIKMAIWRSSYALTLKDNNRIKQNARQEMKNLIVTDLVATFKHYDPEFNEKEFTKSIA